MADQRSARSKLNKKEQRSLRASKSRMSQRKRKPQKVSKRATNRSKELTRKPSAEQVGSVFARKPSAEQMEPSRSVFAKKPSCEPLDSPVRPSPGVKPPVALPKPGTVPSPRGPSPVIAPAPVAQVQVKKSETFDKTAVKKMEDRIKKKKEDKEKKDKEKELNKQKQKKKDTLKAGDEAFPKYTMLKTTEEVSKYSQIQAVDGMASVKVTGKAYLGRLKNKGFKNNDNNGQLFLKDPVSGKDKPFWHSDQLYKPPLTDDELVLNAETILAVVQGQVQLSKSDEDWTAKCDQFAKLSTLQEKDEAAFSNAIIKGNSVRSMMNVDRPSAPEITATTTEERLAQEMDFHMKKLQESENYTLGEVHFHEPTMARVYDTINRANIHLEPFTPPAEICALFIFSQYFLFSTARLIVVGYQSGLLTCEGLPEENALIVACSWVRIYFLVMLQTITIPLIIERELAFYFIQDYSTKTRLWIPVLIIFVFVFIPTLCATAAVFEWVPILCGLFFLDGLPGIVFPLFLWNYRKTWLLNNALKKRKFTRVKYTLAVRYQLEENLSFAEGIVFACAVIIVVHVMTFSQLILSQFAIFPSETNDILLRLFHLLIAADGPIITFGLFAHNAYFKKVVKEMFCGAPVEPYRDEGDSYFEQLEMQWEEPTEKKRKTNRQKAFLMRILWIYEE